MRDLALTLAIPLALIWGLFSPQVSVLVMNWIWFQRPYDFSWGMWNTLPTFKIALAVAILSNVMHGQFRPRLTPLLAVYLVFLSWLTLSAFTAYDTVHAWEFYAIYLPSMWVSPVVMLATIRDLRLLKLVFWVAVGGLGLNGAKVGLSLTVSGGGVLQDQISGFVGDNNVFALVLCMVVAVLIGMRSTLPDRRIARLLFWAGIGLIVLCIVYTRSRGAYVALGATLLVGSLLGPRPVRNTLLVVAVAVIGYWILPDENFERLSTLRDVRSDGSAMGRIENWKLAWDAAVAHPLLGVGIDNHIPYNVNVVQPGVQVRVAHNVYFQVLAESGFPALALYLGFLFGTIVSLYRTWRFATRMEGAHPDAHWVGNLAFWTFCAVIGYAVGAMFLNTLYIEFPWMVMFYGSLLGPLFRQALAVRSGAGGTSGALAGSPKAAAPEGAVPGFGRASPVRTTRSAR